MKKVFHYSLFVCCLWSFPFEFFAQNTGMKAVYETFPLSDKGEVSIINKYGNIEFHGWDKDSVSVRLILDMEERDEDILERFDPEFNHAQEYLEVTAGLKAKSQSYFSRLFRDINPIEFNKTQLDIHIVVYLPSGAHLKAENKYGDVMVYDCHGRFSAKVEHGDIRISGPIDFADAEVKFGLFRAHSINRAQINMSSGRVDISLADHIQLTSAGSEIEIDSVNTLRLGSEKDVIKLTEVNTLTGDMRFSEVSIEHFNGFGDMSLHQGELDIFDIGREPSTIHLKQNASDVEIRVGNVGLEIEAELEAGLLRLPKSAQSLDVNVIDEKREKREVRAKLGAQPYNKLIINSKKGFILIKH